MKLSFHLGNIFLVGGYQSDIITPNQIEPNRTNIIKPIAQRINNGDTIPSKNETIPQIAKEPIKFKNEFFMLVFV